VAFVTGRFALGAFGVDVTAGCTTPVRLVVAGESNRLFETVGQTLGRTRRKKNRTAANFVRVKATLSPPRDGERRADRRVGPDRRGLAAGR
jgi:hypothetical protein